MSTTPRINYRSETIGSLLRPEYLKQAVAQREAGVISSEELAAVEDRAVREAVALQEACDIDVVTDGEMRRQFWFDPLTESLAGYDRNAPAPAIFTAGQEPQRAL